MSYCVRKYPINDLNCLRLMCVCVCAIMVRWSMIIITLKRNGKCTEYGVLVHITCQFLVQLRVTIRNNETSSEFAKIFFRSKIIYRPKECSKTQEHFRSKKRRSTWMKEDPQYSSVLDQFLRKTWFQTKLLWKQNKSTYKIFSLNETAEWKIFNPCAMPKP